jgi:uncharacterized protein YecE (DUF72 family)
MQTWIGTSGYSYSDWVGPFYPPGTRPGRMLAYYAREFPLVELNFSFYRLPTTGQLAKLAAQTPAGFQFLVKIPRTLSHDRNPAELPAFREAVAELKDKGRLLGVLAQLPQSCHHDRDARAWVEFLGSGLGDCSLAVEFRHRSWARPDVPAWLADRGLDLVAVDVPELPGLYPRGLVRTSSTAYVRFHSRVAGNWYQSDKERYDYDYSDAELTGWVSALAADLPADGKALLLFNNCHRSQAVLNARRMRELVGRLAPQLGPVGPVGPPEPQQRSLFD